MESQETAIVQRNEEPIYKILRILGCPWTLRNLPFWGSLIMISFGVRVGFRAEGVGFRAEGFGV